MAARVAVATGLCAGALTSLMLLGCGETSSGDATPMAGAGTAGSAGSLGSGGSAPHSTSCGGELVGKWQSFGPSLPSVPNPNVDECWNLMGEFRGDVYGAISRYPKASGQRFLVRFTADSGYSYAVTNEGPVSVEYAASCLVTDDGRSPTCGQLQTALLESGLGEGSYRDTMCSERVGGGCSCTVQVSEVGGGSGAWTANVRDGSLQLTPPAPRPAFSTHYCIDADELRFTDDIDQGWPWARGVVLSRYGCDNGLQDFDESGVDCGGACDQGCPAP